MHWSCWTTRTRTSRSRARSVCPTHRSRYRLSPSRSSWGGQKPSSVPSRANTVLSRCSTSGETKPTSRMILPGKSWLLCDGGKGKSPHGPTVCSRYEGTHRMRKHKPRRFSTAVKPASGRGPPLPLPEPSIGQLIRRIVGNRQAGQQTFCSERVRKARHRRTRGGDSPAPGRSHQMEYAGCRSKEEPHAGRDRAGARKDTVFSVTSVFSDNAEGSCVFRDFGLS